MPTESRGLLSRLLLSRTGAHPEGRVLNRTTSFMTGVPISNISPHALDGEVFHFYYSLLPSLR